MLKSLAAIAVLFIAIGLPNKVYAFKCPANQTIEDLYDDAERVFLIYVTETKLEESLNDKYGGLDLRESIEQEAVKFISVSYKVIEDFKGDQDFQPTLLDMLGIGTGYVGLTPGVYYLVMLPVQEKSEVGDYRYVSLCDVPYSHYRLNVERFQDELEILRKQRG